MGLTALAGWYFDIPLLRKGSPKFSSVAPNAALCFILSSISFAGVFFFRDIKIVTTAKLISWLVITIAVLTLLESLFEFDLYIDDFLIQVNSIKFDPTDTVKMADVTILNFIMLNLMLIFPYLRSKNFFLIFIAFPFFSSILALAGFAYDVSALYSIGNFYRISIYTSIGFAILSIGILLQCKETFFVKTFYSKNVGGILLRKLLPLALLLIITVKFFKSYAISAGLFSIEFGEAIESVVELILLVILIVWNAGKIMVAESRLNVIRSQNQFLANIVESSSDAIHAQDMNGIITSWNKGAEKIYLYKANEIIGKHISSLISEDKKNGIELLYSMAVSDSSKAQFETTRVRKDGQLLSISAGRSLIKDQNGNIIGISTIERDITEQRRTQYALLESERSFKNIVETAQEGVWIGNTDGIITYVNKRMTDLLGTTPERIIGLHFSDFMDEEGINVARAQLEKRKNGISDVYENKFRKTNGKFFHALISSSPIIKDGKVTGTLGMISDITTRKLAEQELIKINSELESRVKERTLELTSANKELESFAYSVSHDLRAPLRGIDGFSIAILEDYKDKLDDDGKNYLTRIRAGTQKMGVLIDDMLRLSRINRNEVSRKNLDLSAIAKNIAEVLQNTSIEHSVVFNIEPEITIYADPNLMSILLENLLSNSWKFTSKIQNPKIVFGKFIENNETIYFVRDNGIGFDTKYADKLFGPFQRMHSSKDYEGTGIGLATVKRIVQKHGGRVWAESEVNKGSTIFFTIK